MWLVMLTLSLMLSSTTASYHKSRIQKKIAPTYWINLQFYDFVAVKYIWVQYLRLLVSNRVIKPTEVFISRITGNKPPRFGCWRTKIFIFHLWFRNLSWPTIVHLYLFESTTTHEKWKHFPKIIQKLNCSVIKVRTILHCF